MLLMYVAGISMVVGFHGRFPTPIFVSRKGIPAIGFKLENYNTILSQTHAGECERDNEIDI